MKRSIVTILSILFLLSYVVSNYRKQTPESEFDLDALGRTPVVMNGRIQPLDSVARNSLLVMNGKRTATYEDGTRHQAIEWLAELMFEPALAADRPVFRIYDDTLRSMLPQKKSEKDRSALQALLFGAGSGQFYYSFMELRPFYDTIRRDAVEASGVDAQIRTRYQSAAIDLANNMIKFHSLSTSIHHGETPSYLEEIQMLQSVLPQGLEAFRNRERGEEFSEEALAQMMTFGSIPSHLASTTFCWLPPDSAPVRCVTSGARISRSVRPRSACACSASFETRLRRA